MFQSNGRPMPPFGMDMAKYQAMYGEPLPTALIVLIMLAQPYRRTAVSNPLLRQEAELRRLLARPELDPRKFLLAANMTFELRDGLSIHQHKVFRATEHNDWMLDCGMLQIGFVDPAKVGNSPVPTEGIFHAMQIYDSMVCDAQSIEAADHSTYAACDACYALFRQDVGDIYRTRLAIMNRGLVEYSNAVLIAVWACLCGEDGVAAYMDFKSKGGIFHLQYPALYE
jgi:hypothetical protein